jgi:hypothetical protein
MSYRITEKFEPLFQKIFANWRKDINQNHFFIKHGCSVPKVRWKMQHITSLKVFCFIAEYKPNFAFFDDRHLFVRVRMCRRNDIWCKSKPANHDLFTNDHLPLNAFTNFFKRNCFPIILIAKYCHKILKITDKPCIVKRLTILNSTRFPRKFKQKNLILRRFEVLLSDEIQVFVVSVFILVGIF